MKQLSSNYQDLCTHMVNGVQEGASVDEWNAVREEAKKHFTSGTISRLDASGFIKEFYLTPASYRL
jgi:hypothetical protein